MINIDWTQYFEEHPKWPRQFSWFGWVWIHVDREAAGFENTPMSWYRFGNPCSYWRIIKLDEDCRWRLDHVYICAKD